MVFMVVTNGYALHYSHPDAQGKHGIGAAVTADGFIGIELQYGYRIPNIFKEHDLEINGSIGGPLFGLFPPDSLRICGGVALGLVDQTPFYLSGMAHVLLQTTKNGVGRFAGIGFDLQIQPAFHFNRGYIGLELGWRQMLSMYMHHNERVVNTFSDRYGDDSNLSSEGPIDGWFGVPATQFIVAIVGGMLIKKRTQLYLSGGLLLTPARGIPWMEGMIGLIPIYLQMGGKVHF